MSGLQPRQPKVEEEEVLICEKCGKELGFALIEGLTLRKRDKESTIPVVLLILIFLIGMYFVVQIVFFDYDFDNSEINANNVTIKVT